MHASLECKITSFIIHEGRDRNNHFRDQENGRLSYPGFEYTALSRVQGI